MAKKNMSFLPEEYLERRAARRTNITCIVLFIIVMGGVVAGYFVTDWKRAEVRERQLAVNAQFEEAARRLEQLEQLQSRKQQMIRKANITSALVERIPRSLLLAEMINHMPEPLSLLEFELETRTLRSGTQPRSSLQRQRQAMQKKDAEEDQQVQVPETEMGIQLVGVAPTDVEVSQFMTSISQHALFYDVSLQYSEETSIESQKMRKFQINLKVNQSVDFQRMEAPNVQRTLDHNPMSDQVPIAPPEMDAPSRDEGQDASDGAMPITDTFQEE